jgi:hypothetical protein
MFEYVTPVAHFLKICSNKKVALQAVSLPTAAVA